MGCGKSSVGRILSQLLCCRFMDLDSVIETSEGRSIPEIFASDGESHFRSLEKTVLSGIISADSERSIAPEEKLVLALGGGTVMTPECAELVRENTLCIYLRASLETLISHLESETSGRPLLSGKDLRDRISELMAKRSATYENTAHVIIDTDGRSIDSIAQEIQHIYMSF